jgi:hypothetical protein
MNNKILIFSNAFFLGAAIFLGCINRTTVPPISKKKCSDCMEYNNVKPASKLDVNLLKAMTLNYQTDPTTGNIDHNKTRSVWISLEKLKQFVYEIESKTCDCDTSKLGVRVYFGVYPNDVDWQQATNPIGFWQDLNNPNASDGDFRGQVIAKNQTLGLPPVNNYAGITTIFMVPTINSSNINWDFDPADNPNGCKGGYNIKKFYTQIDSAKFNNRAVFKTTSAGISVTALSATNHGDACPPPIRGCQPLGSFSGFDHQ